MAPSRRQFANAVVEKANRQMATIGNTSNNSAISSITVPLVPPHKKLFAFAKGFFV